jgi:hypothetical protein
LQPVTEQAATATTVAARVQTAQTTSVATVVSGIRAADALVTSASISTKH